MIQNYSIRVTPEDAFDEHNIIEYLKRDKGVEYDAVRILKKSIDARQRNIFVNLKVCAYKDEVPCDSCFKPTAYHDVNGRPEAIVVGAGPGGLFAALRLIELGIRPILVERGKNVRERKKDIARIRASQKVDPESNYSFGEGGAGAYSDGKLYTRSKKRGDCTKILNVLVQHGANPNILYDAHPHIGTDCLPRVVENIRGTIERCGGEIHFQTKMTALITRRGKVAGIEVVDQEGTTREIVADNVILATGHSARDVYRWLADNGIEMEEKGIAVGVRLEHPSALIDRMQYHNRDGRGRWLPAAEYSMVQQVDGRGVYTFCMCPGGVVVPAATGEGQIVVNGMSPSNRNGRWSNSGIVVETRPEDVKAMAGGDKGVLSTMLFQEELERQCWLQGNMSQTAPAQKMLDFVKGRLSPDTNPTSYAPGLLASPLHFWMPEHISTRLRKAFEAWGRTRRGFLTNEATVIGVETRTSSPVRIVRDGGSLQHVSVKGLYPCGEGAGYAGGIVSAAMDGERCAEAVSRTIP